MNILKARESVKTIPNIAMLAKIPEMGAKVTHEQITKMGGKVCGAFRWENGRFMPTLGEIPEEQIPRNKGIVSCRFVEPTRAVIDVRWGEARQVETIRVTYEIFL